MKKHNPISFNEVGNYYSLTAKYKNFNILLILLVIFLTITTYFIVFKNADEKIIMNNYRTFKTENPTLINEVLFQNMALNLLEINPYNIDKNLAELKRNATQNALIKLESLMAKGYVINTRKKRIFRYFNIQAINVKINPSTYLFEGVIIGEQLSYQYEKNAFNKYQIQINFSSLKADPINFKYGFVINDFEIKRVKS